MDWTPFLKRTFALILVVGLTDLAARIFLDGRTDALLISFAVAAAYGIGIYFGENNTRETARKVFLVVEVLREDDYDAVGVAARVKARFGVDLGHQAVIYPLLRDMEISGLLESYEIETPSDVQVRGGRPRRYYRLKSRKTS